MSMCLVLCSILTVAQASSGGGATTAELEGIYRRAAGAPSLDSAGAVLSAVLVDESKARSAFLTTVTMDERSVYLLLAGPWSSYPNMSWAQTIRLQRVLAESISSKPALIHSILRAERYRASLSRGVPQGSVTSFPFFSHSTYSDDLVEFFVESLRASTSGPAKDLESPFGNLKPIPAEEIEVNLLRTWQLVCGVCDRLDLIDGVTSKNWRSRFPELEKWFSQNRPFLLWDNTRSCMRIDEEAKHDSRATQRARRAIPELKPPWIDQRRP
jgi:hypothetical protein